MDFKTDREKAEEILAVSNGGKDLPEHQWHVVTSALRGELGRATRMVFEDLWEQKKDINQAPGNNQ